MGLHVRHVMSTYQTTTILGTTTCTCETMKTEQTRSSRYRSLLSLTLIAVAAVGFLFAIQLLSEALQTLSPAIRPLFHRRMLDGIQLVGMSWLSAYVLMNGSVVAAIALSLFSAGLIGVSELFLLIAGSRLGAAGIVLLIGALDFLRIREYSLSEAMQLGMLTFVVGHTIYVPAIVFGAGVMWLLERSIWLTGVEVDGSLNGFAFLEPYTAAIIRLLGAAPSALLALLLFVGSLHLLDSLFGRVDTNWLREQVFVLLRRRWLSFGFGLGITAVATSVAFSMGVIVPIYNRGYITRREIIPYIIGASLGTLTDTLIVAIVLNSDVGVVTILVLFAIAAVCAGAALLFYDVYYGAVNAVQERLLRDEQMFVAFLTSLVVVPLVLVIAPAL